MNHRICKVLVLAALFAVGVGYRFEAVAAPVAKKFVTAPLKLNPPATGKLADLIKRTRNDQVYDEAAMKSLFFSALNPADASKELRLPAGQGVPLYINFIERFLNARANRTKIHSEYGTAMGDSMYMLRSYRGQAAPAVPVLLRVLKKDNLADYYGVDQIALDTLLLVAPNEPALNPYILKRLHDTNEETLKAAAQFIAKRGATGAFAIPNLLKLIQADFVVENRKCYAYEALGAVSRSQFNFSVAVATRKLAKFGSLATEESAAAFETLVRARGKSASAAPTLAGLLKTRRESHVRYAICRALEAGGQVAKPQILEVVLLHPGSQNGDSSIADLGLANLVAGAVSSKTPQAVPVLIKGLRSNSEIRYNALLALSNMGQTAKPALPTIITSLEQEMKGHHYNTLYAYVFAFEALGPGTPALTQRVYDLARPNSPYLSDEFRMPHFRNDWLRMLAAIGMPTDPKKREFVFSQTMDVLKGYNSPVDGNNVGSAARAAGALKMHPEQVVPLLTKFLSDADPKKWLVPPPSVPEAANIRTREVPEISYGFHEVIRALGEFGPQAKSAVPTLRKYSQMPWNAVLWEVKPDAAAALKRIGS